MTSTEADRERLQDAFRRLTVNSCVSSSLKFRYWRGQVHVSSYAANREILQRSSWRRSLSPRSPRSSRVPVTHGTGLTPICSHFFFSAHRAPPMLRSSSTLICSAGCRGRCVFATFRRRRQGCAVRPCGPLRWQHEGGTPGLLGPACIPSLTPG